MEENRRDAVEREEEPGRREDDSEHVLKQQHTSEGQATVSAYSIGDPSSK